MTYPSDSIEQTPESLAALRSALADCDRTPGERVDVDTIETIKNGLDGLLNNAVVYVTTVEHRHGSDTWANFTAQGAEDMLYAYVENNWSDQHRLAEEFPDGIPADKQEAITAYFHEPIDEFYNQSLVPIID